MNANKNFYRDIGVDKNQIFDGKEFVFELGASCRLTVSIPGPNINKSCPSSLRGFNFGRNFTPSLGTTRSTLFSYMASGRALGLSLETGVGFAAINPGAELQAVNGGLKIKTEGHRAYVSRPLLSFTRSSQVKTVTLTENVTTGHTSSWGMILKAPEYKAEARLVPRIGIDLGIYDWNHVFAPYNIDDLSVSLGEYKLKTHANTPNRYAFQNIGATRGF